MYKRRVRIQISPVVVVKKYVDDVSKFNKSKQYICGLCKTVNYCSKECQKKYWPNHKNLCQSIEALEEQRQERIDQSCLFNSNLSQHGREKEVGFVGFVGEKCLVKCTSKCIADKNPTVMLLDTGAQVSVVSKSYLTNDYPELIMKPLKEILENGDGFRVQ